MRPLMRHTIPRYSQMVPRPRSELARQSVLAAMRRSVWNGGYEAVTIEGLAAEAAVSKQTIYRWWPTKAAILGESLLQGDIPIAPSDPVRTGDLGTDLRAWLKVAGVHLARPENIALVRALIAVSATDPDLGAALNERFTRRTMRWIIDTINNARVAGSVRADVDAAALGDQLLASVVYAALLGRPLDESGAQHIVDPLLHGIAVPPAEVARRTTP